MKPILPSAEDFAELAAQLGAASSPVQTAESVVSYAREHLGADYGGITLIRGRRKLQTVAPSASIVTEVDSLQYELDEGPCRDSAWQGTTLASQNLNHEPRWPAWAPRVTELGIQSVLAVELTNATAARRLGAINLYWCRPMLFTADHVSFAHIFARHAALALVASLEQADLNVALDGRKLIGQAQGILMERYALDEARAFEVLKRYSQDHNLKLRRVAEILISDRKLPAAHKDDDSTAEIAG